MTGSVIRHVVARLSKFTILTVFREIRYAAIIAPASVNRKSGVSRNDSVILAIRPSSAFNTLLFEYFMIHFLRCWYAGFSDYVQDNTPTFTKCQ